MTASSAGAAARTKPPVIDWSTDFDHTDPVWDDNPFPIWDDLRMRCPIAHSDRYNGVYLPTRHEDISAIAYDIPRGYAFQPGTGPKDQTCSTCAHFCRRGKFF